MLFVRKGRKNAKSFGCVLPYSRYLRFSRTIVFFRFVHKCTGLLLAHTAVRNELVMPAEAGIQRLKSLDYRIHPCILPLRASRWLFKSAPGRFSPAKNMPE
jgi:hypothetical protein